MPLTVLAQLESALQKTVAELQGLRAENADLKEAIQQLSENLEELKREKKERDDAVQSYQKERTLIRSFLERVMNNLAVLEEDKG